MDAKIAIHAKNFHLRLVLVTENTSSFFGNLEKKTDNKYKTIKMNISFKKINNN
jgi:hypothetical protein